MRSISALTAAMAATALPEDFRLDRLYFFSAGGTVVDGVPAGAAPPSFYPANFHGDLYYAGTADPGAERDFIAPGLFLLKSCGDA